MLSTLTALLLPALALAAPTHTQTRRAVTAHLVHPGTEGGGAQCLTVIPDGSGKLIDGSLVANLPCGAAPNQDWEITRGLGVIKIAGTSNLCLDTGDYAGNGAQAKVWTCYGVGFKNQAMYYTDSPDNHIAVYQGSLCLDRDVNTNRIQFWQCGSQANQQWVIDGSVNPPTPSSSSVAPPPASSSSAIPSSSSVAPPAPSGAYSGIHPKGVEGQCLTVVSSSSNGVLTPKSGDLVQVYPCNGGQAQNWAIARGDGKVKLRNAVGSYCLDAGVGPHNNVELKVWECLDVPQQQWYYTDDNRIAITGGNQCADLRDGSLSAGNVIQTYQCTTGNTNQIFTVGGL